METFERPKTGRGFRHVRSNGDQEEIFDESKTGRPTSRMGFRPDTYDRHDYDEFSRQEQKTHSPSFSPRGGNNSPETAPIEHSHYSSSHKHVVGSPYRMSVSPHEEYLSAQSPTASRLLSRETIHHRSPGGSPHSDFPRRTYSHMPEYHQGDTGDEGQVFEFENTPSDYIRRESHLEEYQQVNYQDRTEGEYNRHMEQEATSGYTPILSGKNRYHYEHYQPAKNDPETEVLPIHEDPNTFSSSPRSSGPVQDSYSTPSRPRSSRPKSARRRPQSSRKRRQEQQQETEACAEPDSTTVRPHSSFLRYKPLPAIGKNEKLTDEERANELAEQTKQLHLKEQQAESPNASYPTPYRQLSFSSAKDILYNNQKETSDQSDFTYQRETSFQSGITSLHSADENSETNVNELEGQTCSGKFEPHKLPDEPSDQEMRLLLAIKLPDGKRVQRHFRLTDRIDVIKQFAENKTCGDLTDYCLSCNDPKCVFTNITQLIGEAGLKDRTMLYVIKNS